MDDSRSACEAPSATSCELGGLLERMEAVEATLDALTTEVRTRRIVVTATDGRERLVAEVVEGVLELRSEIASGQRQDDHGCPTDGVLVFTNPGRGELPSGAGVQVWVGGNLVRDWSWWADEPAAEPAEPAGPG